MKRVAKNDKIGKENMKINVKISTNLVPSGDTTVPTKIELDEEKNTVLDLLRKLNDRFPHLKLIDSDQMGEDLRYVYVNGISHFDLPNGLKTNLKESDSVHVEIFMEPLAGG